MSAVPTRVAVAVGTSRLRMAGAVGDGEPWLLAEVAAPGPGVRALVADVVGAPPHELVLVHPPAWPSARVAAEVARCAGVARQVRAVPAPVAVAGSNPAAVLDVGGSGAEATRVAGGRAFACRTRPAGGAALDEVVLAALGPSPAGADPATRRAEARRVREVLSLLPAVPLGAGLPVQVTAAQVRPGLAAALGPAVEALRAVLAAAGPAPVLLVGGVARAPLLAELLDEAGIADVTVVARPDAAAVLGALRTPPAPAPPPVPARSPAARRRLRPLPPRRRTRTALALAAVAVGAAALLGLGALLPPASAPAAPVPAGVLVQYGYRLDVPAGWEHTGGLPERRRTLLTPVAAPEGSDLIAVELSPLGYDADAEPQRAQAELRAEYDAAVAAGSPLSGYVPAARTAGRTVTTYRQQDPDGRTVVDWFVVLDGPAQLSVGCRHTAAGAEAVLAACAVVVGSIRRT
ncbi:type VII secretion-associated protein [Pseudonocardia nigra]|uniref:type VII secretion-associated protein n=1 Tax=Pseudonocardia nigra TaxID=1921578 RepID=UPI001C5CE76E|nr:type VII secretion-associated protein [Pseudonocardia nigra]